MIPVHKILKRGYFVFNRYIKEQRRFGGTFNDVKKILPFVLVLMLVSSQFTVLLNTFSPSSPHTTTRTNYSNLSSYHLSNNPKFVQHLTETHDWTHEETQTNYKQLLEQELITTTTTAEKTTIHITKKGENRIQ